jgi:hypothetical protein
LRQELAGELINTQEPLVLFIIRNTFVWIQGNGRKFFFFEVVLEVLEGAQHVINGRGGK